jgi:predicted dienelactone hydrolase
MLIASLATIISAVSSSPVHAAAPSAADAMYKRDAGPFDVDTADIVLKDAARSKDLNVRVRVPIAKKGAKLAVPEGGWPLVIFSHGLGGSGPSTFNDLTKHWASHGYVVMLPTHADSIGLKLRNGEPAPDITNANDRMTAARNLKISERTADVRLILDQLDEVAKQVPALTSADKKANINPKQIVMAGHSAGAYTTQVLIGVKARGRGVGAKSNFITEDLGDKRFCAGMIVSGQGTTSMAFTEDSWKELKVPTLVLAGSLDTSPPGTGRETPESRQHPFTLATGTAKGGQPSYLLFIEGATHGSYAGKSTSRVLGEEPTTDVKKIQDAVASATLAFLDAHARHDADAKKYLESDKMKDVIPGKVRWEKK